MKRFYLFITLAMVAGMTVSCKNNKKADSATEEVIEATKAILADDVLATLDSFAQTYVDEAEYIDVSGVVASYLTEDEKLIKPDYLLDPYIVNDLVSKSQKVNALAILIAERPIRADYNLSVDASDEAIARLVAELDHPILYEDNKNMSFSEKAAKTYEICKERGELQYYWKFSFAAQVEIAYLISQNVGTFFNTITDEQYTAAYNRYYSCLAAMRELAKYDDEIAFILDRFDENRFFGSDEEAKDAFLTRESAQRHYTEARETFAVQRNNLLK